MISYIIYEYILLCIMAMDTFSVKLYLIVAAL